MSQCLALDEPSLHRVHAIRFLQSQPALRIPKLFRSARRTRQLDALCGRSLDWREHTFNRWELELTGTAIPEPGSVALMSLEAQDSRGRWKSIEPLPSSWCGNSYFDVQLKPGQAWTLMGIRHSGTFKTKLRFKLNGKTPICSNEFDGSIDPAQFTIPKSEMELLQERVLKARKRRRAATSATQMNESPNKSMHLTRPSLSGCNREFGPLDPRP